MNCWHCGEELIWGGDHDCDSSEEYLMETNLSCPNCNSFVLVYLPFPEESEPDEALKVSGVATELAD